MSQLLLAQIDHTLSVIYAIHINIYIYIYWQLSKWGNRWQISHGHLKGSGGCAYYTVQKDSRGILGTVQPLFLLGRRAKRARHGKEII